jgi:uncharacterized SAM-binding protein YcdF (DUF218 family)
MDRRALAIIMLAGTNLAVWSPQAHAQRVPWIVLPLATSPLIAFALAAAVGMAAKSWRAGLVNAALVAAWVAWFVAASRHTTSDLLVWAPIAALGAHMLAMAAFLASRAIRRADRRRPDHRRP